MKDTITVITTVCTHGGSTNTREDISSAVKFTDIVNVIIQHTRHTLTHRSKYIDDK